MKKILGIFVLVCIFSICFVPNIMAKENIVVEAQEGVVLDFINNAPSEETTYNIGSGKVVYKPLENNSSVITLENVTLNAEHEIKYWTNKTITALAGTGDVKLVLKGINKVYLNASQFCSGLLFYDSNVTIEGDGSLFIGPEEGNQINNSTVPFNVMGNYDVLNNLEEGNFNDTGNFTLKSGIIELSAYGTIGMGALTVHNDVNIEGGKLITKGQANAIYSVYNNINITNGEVKCIDYNIAGLYSRRGDVNISGKNTVISLNGNINRDNSGIIAGSMSPSDEKIFEAGSIEISDAKIDINSTFIGMFARYLPNVENSGNIKINSGNITINSKGDNSIVAGIFAQGEDTGSLGDVTISGGTLNFQMENISADTDCYSLGIYSDRDVKIENAKVNITAVGEANISAYGVMAINDFSVLGNNVIIKGSTMATDKSPIISNDIEVEASQNINGNNLESFDKEKLETYKYITLKKVKVNDVVIEIDTDVVQVGKELQFTAKVEGENIEGNLVVWSVTGATSEETKIDENGLLTVGKDEKAKTLTITATSVLDKNVSSSYEIKVDSVNDSKALLLGIIIGIIALFVITFTIWGISFYKRERRMRY